MTARAGRVSKIIEMSKIVRALIKEEALNLKREVGLGLSLEEAESIVQRVVFRHGQLMGHSVPATCSRCGKPHLLKEEDAGSDRETLKLCLECYYFQSAIGSKENLGPKPLLRVCENCTMWQITNPEVNGFNHHGKCYGEPTPVPRRAKDIGCKHFNLNL